MNRFSSLRTMVDRFLVDACTICALGAEPMFDPGTFTETAPEGGIVWTGRCSIRPQTAAVSETGGVQIVTGAYQLTVPVDVTGLEVNQTVTVDESDDPMLVGRVYRIDSIEGGTSGAYRRCTVIDTEDMAEWAEVGS